MYSGTRSAPLGQTIVDSSLSTLSLAKIDFSLSWLKIPPFKGTYEKSAVPLWPLLNDTCTLYSPIYSVLIYEET